MGIIIRQSFKASISNYIGVVLGFFSLFILFPLYFSPEELGAIRLFLELGAVLSAFALLGTNYSINRFFPYFKTSDQKHHGFFFWTLLIPFIGFITLNIFFFIFGNSFFLFLNENALDYKALFPMLIMLIFFNLFITVTETTIANHGRIAVTNLSKEVILRILLILSASLYYFKWIDFEICVWLIASSYGIPLILNILFLSRLTKINLKPDFNFINKNKTLRLEIIKFTMVLMFSALSTLVIPKIDFFLISKLQKDLSNVAIYSIGFYLATFIEIPKRTINQISLPIISNYIKNKEFEKLSVLNKKNGTNQLLIASLLFILIWFNIDNMYEIMPKGEIYKQGKWVVLIIGIAKVIESVNSAYSAIFVNSKLYKWSPALTIFNGVLVILLNYFFISKYGYVGGAYSCFFSILFINAFTAILINSKLKIHPFEKKQFYIYLIFICFISISFIGNWFKNPYIDSITKTLIIGSLYIFIVLKIKVSQDFNELVISKLPYIKKYI